MKESDITKENLESINWRPKTQEEIIEYMKENLYLPADRKYPPIETPASRRLKAFKKALAKLKKLLCDLLRLKGQNRTV